MNYLRHGLLGEYSSPSGGELTRQEHLPHHQSQVLFLIWVYFSTLIPISFYFIFYSNMY